MLAKYTVRKMLAFAWLVIFMPRLAHAASQFEIGAVLWNAGITGHAYDTRFQYPGVSLDLRNDLSLSSRRNPGFWFVWRQRAGYYPDWAFEYTHLYSGGTTFLRANLQWDGVTYAAHVDVHSQVSLRSGHLLAFWSPVDNRLFSLHPGLELRWLTLNIPLSGTAEQTTPVSNFYQAHTSAGNVAWLPMAYLGMSLHAAPALDLDARGAYVRYARSYFFDFHAVLAYRFDSGVMLVGGWRRLRLHFDDRRFIINGDIVFKGFYAGLGYRF